ncbi:MAG TPA: DMT family transporter [Sphingorhabdus sp.]|jgi:drug/metabolite transporter (DMT)-like permease|uniref:DMT family transporter n=1 Tax=Sphingorhabdus sp. TaxID=1902408 RepID=UPI002C583602|nr:DMT family transporter [Sphingorhabdus sp.]HMT41145.1 DMT family transporter [Sphingorhabdus sp.]HMU22420.1 DMT family transporter [Sphingorhabdus sp.]
MTQSPKLDGTGWLLIGILSILWGGAFFLIEVGLRSYPPITLVFMRLALAVPPMWIAMRLMGERLPTEPRIWGLLAIVGALNCALPFILFFWGQQYLDSGYASILNATTPLWGVITAHFLTSDEKANPARIIGVLVGMAGIVVMVGPEAMKGLSNNLLAQIACIVSTIFYSFAAIYGRRLSQSELTPMAVATGQTLVAALMMVPIVAVMDQPWAMPTPRLDSTLAGITLALLSTALAYTLYFRLIDRSGASNAQLVAFLMPILAVILGIAFLGESLTGGQIAGAGLIAVGLAILDGRLVTRFQK